MQDYCMKTSSNLCFRYLLESPEGGDSNKCPKRILTIIKKQMFNEEIRKKQDISYISFCPFRILFNSKFILMATFLRTNAVVVTRIHCISLVTKYLYLLCQKQCIVI